MMDANVEPTPDESDFASRNHGLLLRGDTWYRLNGWGTVDNWSACPLVRVPDDHAESILRSGARGDRIAELEGMLETVSRIFRDEGNRGIADRVDDVLNKVNP
jgi:hypothetical protein